MHKKQLYQLYTRENPWETSRMVNKYLLFINIEHPNPSYKMGLADIWASPQDDFWPIIRMMLCALYPSIANIGNVFNRAGVLTLQEQNLRSVSLCNWIVLTWSVVRAAILPLAPFIPSWGGEANLCGRSWRIRSPLHLQRLTKWYWEGLHAEISTSCLLSIIFIWIN